jgi:hypothetical protein
LRIAVIVLLVTLRADCLRTGILERKSWTRTVVPIGWEADQELKKCYDKTKGEN